MVIDYYCWPIITEQQRASSLVTVQHTVAGGHYICNCHPYLQLFLESQGILHAVHIREEISSTPGEESLIDRVEKSKE